MTAVYRPSNHSPHPSTQPSGILRRFRGAAARIEQGASRYGQKGCAATLAALMLHSMALPVWAQPEQDAAGEAEASAQGNESEARGEPKRPAGTETSNAPGRIEKKPLPWAGMRAVEGEGTLLEAGGGRRGAEQAEEKAPSPEQVAALEELESEVESFGKLGRAYRDTIVAMVRRDYLRQRRVRNESFNRQIREEQRLEDQARARAIELFEEFIQKYPDDPEYTPDAMFRLGELYFERSAIEFQEEMDEVFDERDRRIAEGLPTDDLKDPVKDFTPTIELYRELIRKFPSYERVDGVYYLIGYCINEMGRPEEARLAWLNMVCANHFEYTGEITPEGDGEPSEDEKREAEHPSLALGKQETPTETQFDNPYQGCEPAVEDSKFFAETWLRIGEYHFDYDYSEHGLDKAISAYEKVLSRPEDRNYNLALYKVAWAYYRDSRYPEAIEHFWKLVQWSDEERRRTGRAGSELRAEAIQYLGIAFAYDDWNENQIPDPQEGMPTGLERVQDPGLMPQDKPWTSEVYFQLGSVYFDEAKYPKAIDAWKLALKRWPLDPRAPEIQNQISLAHQRHNQPDKAIAARAELGKYTQGSEWWNANMDHPKEQREAEQLAEESLINTAIIQHQKAQQLRRRCVEQQDPSLCVRAQEEYALAAQAYRGYIKSYPNNPQAYELQYNLADALYWSENYEAAAREYAAVRDSNLDDEFLSVSARLVVESIKRVVEQAETSGELQRRSDPPEPSGDPPQVPTKAMPQLLKRLGAAREAYLERVPPERDQEGVLDAYAFNNALLLYVYGYWWHARERFETIFDERCAGANADETGRVAWLNLRNIAVALNHTERVRELGQELKQRQCTFGAGEEATDIDCEKEENQDEPQCLAGSDLTNLRYQDAVDIFTRAEKASGDEQRRLYEKAATELVKAVNEEPNHPQAPLALEKAAIALERTSRFESAGRLYQRIVDEVGPRKAETPEEQEKLDNILSNAYFRLAFNSNRFFDYERAVENYRILADSQRFAKSNDPKIIERREGALINAAKILEYQQQYARAAEYYGRAADMLEDPAEARSARFRVAEMAFKQERWGFAIQRMNDFIQRYRGDKNAGELLVLAQWRIAQSRKKLGQEGLYRRALQDVVDVYARSGQEPGSLAAEYAAHAKFLLVDEGIEEFERFKIDPGRPRTLEQYVKRVMEQIKEGSQEAKKRAEAYNPVLEYKRPKWTIASFVRQGRIYEILARAVLNTPFVLPADMRRKVRGAPQYVQDDVKFQVEDRIRQVLDAQVRPIECLAVARYALAARAARAGSIDNSYTREAIDRINAYGDERIAECIAEAAAKDSTFSAYQPGEFDRALRGFLKDVERGVSPPPLARGTQ